MFFFKFAARHELRKVVGTNKILIFHCDLDNAIHLKTIGLRPYIILALPSSLDNHRKMLDEKYFTQRIDGYESIFNSCIKRMVFK